MKYFYHGSENSGITELQARSKLHGTQEKVVYFTDNIPYALFYLWDEKHVGYGCKHITGWLKNGTAYYEEQFPNQLKAFYQGASGYLYGVGQSPRVKAVENRESLFYCPGNILVEKVEPVADVYQALMKQEAKGALVVLRYAEQTEQRRKELTDLIAEFILREQFFEQDTQRREFFRTYFQAAWKNAENL